MSIRNPDSGLSRVIAFLILFAGLGSLAGSFYSPFKHSLICNRADANQINCTLIKSALIGESNTELIDDLQGATVKERHSGKKTNYEVVLQTTSGEEVSLLTNPDGGSDNLASSINDFVAAPQQQTLRIQATAWRHIIYLFFAGVLSTGVCLGIILLVSIKTCTFDKSNKKVIIKKQSLVKTKQVEYPLNSLIGLQIYENYGSNKGYKIVLFFRDYQDLHLEAGAVSKRHAEKVVNKIKVFLNYK